jgi:hypothetical protein
VKRIAFIIALVLILLPAIAVTTGLFPTPKPTASASMLASSHSSHRLVATGDCQSKLWGKLLIGTSPVAGDDQVVLDGDAQVFRTRPDPNGLFGFAGLCAGHYAVHVESGDQTLGLLQRFEMDGHNELRQDLAVP